MKQEYYLKDTYSDPPEIQDALSKTSARAAEYINKKTSEEELDEVFGVDEQDPPAGSREQTDSPDAAQTDEQPAPASSDWGSPHAAGSMKERARESQKQREECSRRQIAYDGTGGVIYGNTPPPKPETVDVEKTLLPIITRGDLIPDKQIEFLWKDRFPYQLGLLAGRQGLGKSSFVCYLAAQITNASVDRWEDGAPCPTGCVMFFPPEGGKSATTQRIRNMGGNLKNIIFYDGEGSGRLRPDGTIDIDRAPVVSDTAKLMASIDGAEKTTEQKVHLIVIDPVTDYMGTNKQNDNAEVTNALRGLDYLAVEKNICILIVKHPNKSENPSAAVYNVAGSNAFTSKPRFVYLLDQTPESRKAELDGDNSIERRLVLAGAKSNDFNIKHSIEYQLSGDDDNFHVEITDLGGDWTADSLQWDLQQINGATSKGRGRPADDERNAEIKRLLENGMCVKDVIEKMKASSRTVYKIYNTLKEEQAERLSEFADFGDDEEND